MSAHRIRRSIAAGAGVVMLFALSPVLAWAVSQQYNGKAAGGVNNAGVEFGARLSHGRPAQVRRFAWFNIPLSCSGGARSAVSDTLAKTMPVSATRRFSATAPFNGGRARAVVTGRFSKSFGSARGTLRLTGSVAGCSGAVSGVISWSAPKAGKAK